MSNLMSRLQRMLLAFCVAAMAAWSTGSARAEVKKPEINDDISALGETIKKLPLDKQGEAVDQLRALILTLRCDTVECKLELLRQFSNATEKEKIVTRDTLSKAQLETIWGTLRNIFLLGANFSNENAERIAIAFRNALKETKADLDGPELNELVAQIYGGQPIAIVVKRHIDDLIAILGKNQDLAKNPKLEPELVKLLAALNTIVKVEPARLNIVEAWYGDFHYIRKIRHQNIPYDVNTGVARRVCNATNEVRSACQGKPDCPFAPPMKTKDEQENSRDRLLQIQPAALCGENPTPHAPASQAGLLIVYQCLTLSQVDWDKIEISPQAFEKLPVMEQPLRIGTPTTIRCAANVP